MKDLKQKISIIFILLSVYTTPFILAQNAVGIGTTNPNTNAVLDLVSPNKNQGLLVPKLTKAEREAMISIMTANETGNEGLLVYDTTEGMFFFWKNGAWNRGLSDAVSNGTAQDLSLIGNTLTITDNGSATPIDLSGYLDNTDAQGLTYNIGTGDLSISGGNTVNIPIGGGTDDQQLTFNGVTGILTIEDGNNVTITDTDATNEIQDLSLSTNTLTITNNVSATPIDLSGYLDNTDGQSLSFNGGTGDLSISGGNTVTLPLITDTDDQQLTFNGVTGILTIEDGNNVTITDTDATNEIQDLNLSTNTLSITNNGSATPIDLSGYLDNTDAQGLTYNIGTGDLSISGGNTVNIPIVTDTDTDDQQLTFNGVTGILTIEDGNNVTITDTDATNEIQDLSLSINTLTITNNGSATPIDLSGYLDNTDGQTLSYNGLTGALSIAGGNTVTIPTMSLLGSDDQTLSFNSGTGLLTIEDGNNVTITDTDATNEIQDLSLSTNTLSITNNGSATPIDLSGYLDNTDTQTLTKSGNNISISGGNSMAISGTAPSSGQVLKWDGAEWTAAADLSTGFAGTGTDNYIPKWTTGGTDLSNTSNLFDDGTNVGVGHNNPLYPLDVSGTTYSSGGFYTGATQEYNYTSLKTKYMAIPASSFAGATSPGGNKQVLIYNARGLFAIANDDEIQATVSLPDGAVVRQIDIYARTTGNSATFQFQEIPYGFSNTENILDAFVSSSSGDELVTFNPGNTIDNANNFYRLYINFNTSSANDGVYNVKITYQIDHAD